MSRGSEDESLTANTEHTAFLCLYYHIPQIKSTDFKRSQKIRRGAASCHCFAMGRTAGSFIRPAREPKQKMSRHKRTPMPGILRANGRHRFFGLLSALVPLLRNGANRRVLHPPGKVTNKKMSALTCAHFFVGDLAGNRTRDCAVRGRRLNRLTTRPYELVLRSEPRTGQISRPKCDYSVIIAYSRSSCNHFCTWLGKIFFAK